MNIQTPLPDAAAPASADALPLRILLTGYRSHPHVGGQGVYLRELARALRDLGHQVTVASGPPYPELDAGIALVKLPSLDLFETENAFKAFRPGFLTRWADFCEWASHNTGGFGEPYAFGERLARYLATHHGDFDVIHDNQTLASAFARINRRIPVVATIHHPVAIDRDFALASAEKRVDRWLTRRWYGFTGMQARTAASLSGLLAVSAAARDSHARIYGLDRSRISVAFNGIDHDVFRPDPSTQREAGLIAATASADVPIKGVDVLMEAFCDLAGKRPDLRLELIGRLREGKAKARLDASGLSDRVICRSGVTREEIADLYRRATLVACPARFEGFGFPAAEAMACGAPVVASDGGALPEVVGDAGLVVPAGDSGAFASAMARVLDGPDLARRLGETGTARARQEFDWRRHAEAAVKLYRRALAKC
ncbi:glycosyltransferase family 4 protein [Hyphobacterium marinum]|uniref:Glycosyltransferase family 4 protein n=1 Tax=Hyphobacterium marinum TaxID=3116574 RepID=A0ABU7LZI9_9PROT|nr:glycosyltransferase family 4 protein [Hyphobacterium sp. Y6023]MEE2566981.1 glycosyltransferase family 4 protein [Hyphobacterium sp. Y6023]